MNTTSVKLDITKFAQTLGFDVVGFADPELPTENFTNLHQYIEEKLHGEMKWLEHSSERRAVPKSLWPQVRSIISLGMNYAPSQNPLDDQKLSERGNISVYARGTDYHTVMKRRLKQLGRYLHDRYDCKNRVFVDTAPVMEKPTAQTAGLGWQGKHTNLVSTHYGSWLFLGEVFTTLYLEPDNAERDHCGSCRACLDICPTDAFPAPYRIDARRCISYLTIEHKNHIPRQFRVAIGNRIYGCDDCLAVCPWNKFAQQSHEMAFHARAELTAPRLADLAQLDDSGFRQFFSGSPIKRTGRNRFIRNVVIALGNSGDPRAIPIVKKHLKDETPLVRAMAVWALSRLVPHEYFENLCNQHFENEMDPVVRSEWLSSCQANATSTNVEP